MFAFVIFDKRKRELFLARDRLGIKPLYYYWDGNVFIAASEMKAILAYENLKLNLNYTSLYRYLQFEFFPAPSTIYKNVKKLKPGFYLKFINGHIEKRKYWDIDLSANTHHFCNEKEITSKISSLLEDSVTNRLISDVPLGTFLSGGIDSGLITAMSAKEKQNIKTFTANFSESSYSEREYAEAVAQEYGTEHKSFFISTEIKNNIDTLLDKLDEPFGDISFLPTYYLSKYTRNHVTVALSGDGGDELFGGYYTYVAFLLYDKFLRKFPYGDKVCKAIQGHLPYTRKNQSYVDGLKRFIKGCAYNPTNHTFWMQTCEDGNLLNILDHDVQLLIDIDRCHCDKEMTGNEMLLWDLKNYLPENILYKTDRASMYNSLEVRVPFLDHRLVEYAFSLPFELKINFLTKKYILKKLAAKYLPKKVIKRRKKGFSVPFKNWVKEDLKEYISYYLLSNNSPGKHLFNQTQIESILMQHNQNICNYSHLIWNLLVFNKWYENYN